MRISKLNKSRKDIYTIFKFYLFNVFCDLMELEMHKKYGRELKILNEILVKEYVEYSNKVGKTKAKKSSYDIACNSLRELRNHLEEICCQQYPKEFTTNIYYENNKE